MSADDVSWYHKRPVVLYLILANGITWLCWIPGVVVGLQRGYVLPAMDTYATLFEIGFADSQHLVLSILFSLGVYGPLIGALVATWGDGGRRGLAELWRRVARWRVPARWYLIVVLLAIALPVVPVGIAALAGVTQLRGVNVLGPAYAVFLTFAQILTSGLGEEPGWRGFLLARLQARSSGQKYIWPLGLAWAVWHYPVTILQTLSAMQNVTVAQAIVTILVSLAGHTMSLIGMTYLYVWLVNRTRSVFLAILLHALANVANTMVLSLVTDQQAITMLIALMPWVVVLVQQRALGKERFPGRPASG